MLAVARAQVSLDFPPMPLSRLLPELGKKLGMTMACSGSIRGEVMILRADNTSPDEVMKRVADVAGGEWVKKSTGAVLSRSPEMERQIRRQGLSARANLMRDCIAKMSAEVAKVPVFDVHAGQRLEEDLFRSDQAAAGNDQDPNAGFENSQAQMKLFDRAPANRALVRLLGELNPDELASLPMGQITSYSTSPNRYQRALPGKAAGVIQALSQENDAWRQALLTAPQRPEKQSWLGGDPRMEAHAEGRPAKALLEITVYNRLAEVGVELFVADDQGKLLVHARGSIKAGTFTLEGNAAGLEKVNKNPDFEISSQSKEFQKAFDLDYEKPKPLLTKEWEDIFVNPQLRDPLSFGTADAFREVAKREDKNLIGLITDELIRLPETKVKGSVNLAGYLEYLQSRYGYKVTRANGWIELRPEAGSAPALPNMDREALHRFCVGVEKTGMLSLDSLSEIVPAAGSEDWAELPFDYSAAIAPRLERLLQFQNNGLIRLFAALTPEQRRVLREGGSFTASQLSPAAKTAVEDLFVQADFSASDGIAKDDRVIRSADPPLESRPSELLGAVRPFTMTISSKPSMTDVMVVGSRGGEYVPWTRVMPMSQFASMLGRDIGKDPRAKTSELWPAKQLKLPITISVGNGYSYRGNLEEIQVDVRQKPTPYSALPEALRSQIEAAAAREAAKPKPNGGGVPPPSH